MRRNIPAADPKLTVAILAAGLASRFGAAKLDAPLAGRAVADWVMDAVAQAGLKPGLVIVGPEAPAFLNAYPEWTPITNAQPEMGQGGSVALAAKEALVRGSEHLLILLADMPLIEPEFLRSMVHNDGAAATRYPSGRPGVPALFPRRLLGRLAKLEGDRGAAAILADEDNLTLIAPPENMLTDIDKPVDLERAEALLRHKTAKEKSS